MEPIPILKIGYYARQDYVQEKDPQLDVAIKTCLAEIKKNHSAETGFWQNPRKTLP